MVLLLNGVVHLQQSGPSMAAIVGSGGPCTATQFAVDGLGGPITAEDHLQLNRSHAKPLV